MLSDAVSRFFAYARERYQIFLKRSEGREKPWTSDPILQGYRFCNIFREDDTVTRWIAERAIAHYRTHPNLFFLLAVCRYINRISTLECIFPESVWDASEEYHPIHLTTVLEQRAGWGYPVYTSAYMIRAESDPRKPWYSWSKHRYITEIVLGRLWERRREFQDLLRNTHRLEEVWAKFQEPYFIGWGPFMAYEVVTDLSYAQPERWSDRLTWANAGPGALRGLQRLHGGLGAKLSGTPVEEMRYLLGIAVQSVEGEWPNSWPVWDMRTVEHTLCEFDKYERVRLGEGKPRQRYEGV